MHARSKVKYIMLAVNVRINGHVCVCVGLYLYLIKITTKFPFFPTIRACMSLQKTSGTMEVSSHHNNRKSLSLINSSRLDLKNKFALIIDNPISTWFVVMLLDNAHTARNACIQVHQVPVNTSAPIRYPHLILYETMSLLC